MPKKRIRVRERANSLENRTTTTRKAAQAGGGVYSLNCRLFPNPGPFRRSVFLRWSSRRVEKKRGQPPARIIDPPKKTERKKSKKRNKAGK